MGDRHGARRVRAIAVSALFGVAFLGLAIHSGLDGDWRDARDVGLLGLLFGAPAIVATVRICKEPLWLSRPWRVTTDRSTA
jgi:hypothetical protein